VNQRPIQHLCYIVDDIPTAVDQWAQTFGAGPFFWLGQHIQFDETVFRGEACTFDHSSAIGQWGDVMVELSTLHDLAPAEFEPLFAGSGGVAHISYIVDDAATESARLEAAGMPAFLHARQGPIAITFHECPSLGHAIEIHQHGAVIDGMFAVVRQAAQSWHGSDPLREFPMPG
jgi:hypothetical protein